MKKRLVCTVMPFILVLASCNVVYIPTYIYKQYPPHSKDVVIKILEGDSLLKATDEEIGVFNYVPPKSEKQQRRMVDTLKTYAREIGGDAIYIPTITQKGKFVSYRGKILKTERPVYNTAPDTDSIMSAYKKIKQHRSVPQYELSFDISAGILGGQHDKVKTPQEKFNNAIRNGLSWGVNFDGYFPKGIGLGVLYSGYSGSARNPENENCFMRLNYIAPEVKLKYRSYNIMGDMSFGIGYHHLGLGIKDYDAKAWGGTVGFHLGFGVDWLFSQQASLGMTIRYVIGNISDSDIKNRNIVITYDEEAKTKKVNMSSVNMGIVLHFYMGKLR